jgi:hypothetical protein
MAKSILPTHSQTYTNLVLPQLFHGAPKEFMTYLERDGNQFLLFYWNSARERLPVNMRASSYGLNYAIHTPAYHTQLVLITLPAPAVDGDAYFSALVYRPDRRLLLVTDMTRVFNLERISDEQGVLSTLLVQWTTHLERIEVARGVEATPERFMEAVMQHLDD